MEKVLTDLAVLGIYLSGVLVFVVGVKKAMNMGNLIKTLERQERRFGDLEKKKV